MPKSLAISNLTRYSLCCNGRALDRVTKQKHRPNGQKMSKKCPKIVSSVPPDNFWTFFGHFFDIFRTFFRHFSDILSTFPFSGLSNDLPVTTLLGRTIHWPMPEWTNTRMDSNGAAPKVPEFFKCSTRMLLRRCFDFSPKFSRFFVLCVSWETETTKKSPKISHYSSMPNPGKLKETNHKSFLGSRQGSNASLGGGGLDEELSGPSVLTDIPFFFWNAYGPMALKSLWKFWFKPASVHRVLFSALAIEIPANCIIAISAGMSALTFNRILAIEGCDFAGALRFQILQFLLRCQVIGIAILLFEDLETE